MGFPTRYKGRLQLSNDGIALLKQLEGCRLEAYKDSGGTWTIGYGHTIGVERGMRLTLDQCNKLLMCYLPSLEASVLRGIKVSVTQNEFDALMLLAYNIGRTAFATSTLLKKLNAGDKEGVAFEWLRWDMVNGAYNLGLARRRRKELLLFKGSTPT